ncbi:Glycosyltransferase involved in cell wall bisynthesis [Pseudobutyrivibrio sp. UC1225]|uniref:glycosyltransferase n=1 Tax=Pseudobutyrivibrio sp. UC1225 TaxID=1798185 RepID=UPI0008EFFD77|nr:glycosyltransferase [Pseudobutyrivibrio sp. UC1225]SFN78806.1 Glycosyltransferase involved in cell wall bisynthesis [Pseudobutyrivibrio sp. UC1225]
MSEVLGKEVDYMSKEYEVTINVLCYEPIYDKLIETIESILIQEDVNLQIVISDDGSSNNHFEELEQYFYEKKFFDYKLCAARQNIGTVKNLLNSIRNSDGKYLKCISPGDQLYGEKALRKWLDYIVSSQNRWSFCDIVCYHKGETGEIVDRVRRRPTYLMPYIKKNDLLSRINYLIFSDNANGASILGEKELFLEYMQEIDGIIKYSEDMIWRICMYDDVIPLYFDEVLVKYEWGTGVSTSRKKKWHKIISEEWKACSKIILHRQSKNWVQRILKCGIILENTFFMKIVKFIRKKYLKAIYLEQLYTVKEFP